MSIKNKILNCIVIFALFQASTGAGQERAASPKKSRNTMLEEVVVTMTKQDESVQTVAAAVTAYSGEMIKAANITTYRDLGDMTPGMTVRSEGDITIRGIGKAVSGGASPIAFHVNGKFLDSRGEPFYDIENVQVLRGPSGTAFGRNATGGAINVLWARPDAEWGMGGDYRESSFDKRQFRTWINAPLLGEDDTRLLSRWVFYKDKMDGYVDNLLESDTYDSGSQDYWFARGTISSEINDEMLLTLRGIYSKLDKEGVDSASLALHSRQADYHTRMGASELPKDDPTKIKSNMRFNYPDYPGMFIRERRLELDFNWALNDVPLLGDIELDVLGMDLRGNMQGMLDLDGTDAPIIDARSIDPRRDKANAELRLSSQYDGGFNWIAGAFWYRATTKRSVFVDAAVLATAFDVFQATGQNPVAFITDQSPTMGPESPSEVDTAFINERRTEQSRALFANIKLDLQQLFDWADIEVTLGARINRDFDRLSVEHEYVDIVAVDGTPLPGGPQRLVEVRDAETFGEFDAKTGEIGAKWFYLEDGMIYAKLAKGYKAGKAERIQRINNPVNPEFLDSFEMGWKQQFLGGGLTMNFATFIYDYTDLQITKIVDQGFQTENAGEASINGAELEMQFIPSANLYTQASVSYNNNEFGFFCGRDNELEEQELQEGCTDERQPHQFKGAQLSDAPRWTVAFLARYEWDLGQWGTLAPLVKTVWVDDYSRRPYGNPIDDIDSYIKTDVRLSWESQNKNYKIEAFIENLEDNEIFYGNVSLPDPGAYALAFSQQPRTTGVIFEARM